MDHALPLWAAAVGSLLAISPCASPSCLWFKNSPLSNVEDKSRAASQRRPRRQKIHIVTPAHDLALPVIDTPPHADAMARQAAKLADLILIPCRPRAFDLAAIEATAELVKASGNTPRERAAPNVLGQRNQFFDHLHRGDAGDGRFQTLRHPLRPTKCL